MPVINVTKPFKVQFARGQEARAFTPGEHELSKEELKHWFIQGCIKEGRAVLIAKASEEKAEAKPAEKPEDKKASEEKAAAKPAGKPEDKKDSEEKAAAKPSGTKK